MGVPLTNPTSQLCLPPGFRFCPTDEELLVQYLCRKVAGHHFPLQIIGEIDLYKFDPWDLPSRAIFGEREWYFFSPRDRKYPNGSRPNRLAGSGYWKATGTDKMIISGGKNVGIKKALVFYTGRAPKGTKTSWIMHEYRLSEPQSKNRSRRLDDWVLCRIYKKSLTTHSLQVGISAHASTSSPPSKIDDVFDSCTAIDDDDDHPFFNFPRNNPTNNKTDLQNSGDNFGWLTLAGINSMPENFAGTQAPMNCQTQTQGLINGGGNGSFVHPIPPGGHVDRRYAKEVESGNSNQGVGTLEEFLYARGFMNSDDLLASRDPTRLEDPRLRL